MRSVTAINKGRNTTKQTAFMGLVNPQFHNRLGQYGGMAHNILKGSQLTVPRSSILDLQISAVVSAAACWVRKMN